MININMVNEVSDFLNKHYSGNNDSSKRLEIINNTATGLKKDLLEFELSRKDYHIPLKEIEANGSYSTQLIGKTKKEYLSKLTLDWKTEDLVKSFHLTNGSLDQWLKSRKDNYCSLAYWKSLNDPYYINDVRVPLKVILVEEVAKTRVKLNKIFREANFKFTNDKLFDNSDNNVVVGIVGNNYPIFYSDYKFVDQIDNKLHDAGIGFKYGHSGKSTNGDIRFSWHFTDKELIQEMEKGLDNTVIPQFQDLRSIRDIRVEKNNQHASGISYRNNYGGRGTLSVGLFSVRLVCTNGTIAGWNKQIYNGIEHRSQNEFVSNIINDIIKLPKEITDKYNFEAPKPQNTAYYLNHKDKLYEHMAISTILSVLNQNERISKMYEKISNLILDDWRYELFKLAESYQMSSLMLDRLITIAVNDPTIKLPKPKFEIKNDRIDHSIKKDNPAEFNVIIETVSALANYYDSVGNLKQSVELQMIGGRELANAKPRTPYQTITV